MSPRAQVLRPGLHFQRLRCATCGLGARSWGRANEDATQGKEKEVCLNSEP